MKKTLLWLTLFSIAMGFLESAVVIYLRRIYYPNGFHFPLAPIEPLLAVTEFWREAATIIMLAGIGILTGKNKTQRFAFFIFCFAIWDIFYYVFLKLLLNWPSSLMDWDILFLIPIPWVSPVIAPVIVSLTMILLTLSVVIYQERKQDLKFIFREWIFLITGSLVIVVSFMWDFVKYIFNGGAASDVLALCSKHPEYSGEKIQQYVPQEFNWFLFSLGEILILLAIVLFIIRAKRLFLISEK